MVELTILSPHRDDAAFSLALALSRWKTLHVKITVVNFFTVTEYAPRALSTRVASISALRKKEDQSALRSIDSRIRLEALDLLDAPLRLGIDVNATCRPETISREDDSQAEILAVQIQKYFRRGLVLAPLALGDHVDHVTVQSAASLSSRDHKLGFYEDLPYATWTPEVSLCAKVQQAEENTGVKLRSAVIRDDAPGVASKRQVIRKYQSQIAVQEANAMAKHAWNYRGGERIWIPKYGLSWNFLIQ